MPGLVRQSTPSVVTWRSILLILLALPGLVSCGTFQASLEVENTMRGPEFTEAPGYVFAENAIFLGYQLSDLQVEPEESWILSFIGSWMRRLHTHTPSASD